MNIIQTGTNSVHTISEITPEKSWVGEMARVPKRYGRIQKQAFSGIQDKVERERWPT